MKKEKRECKVEDEAWAADEGVDVEYTIKNRTMLEKIPASYERKNELGGTCYQPARGNDPPSE